MGSKDRNPQAELQAACWQAENGGPFNKTTMDIAKFIFEMGPSSVEELIEAAMDKHTVRKGRRPHYRRVFRDAFADGVAKAKLWRDIQSMIER